MSEWISVKERYPDFREFGFHTGKKIAVRYELGDEDMCTDYHGFLLAGQRGEMLREFTHWMPLPEPPQPPKEKQL